MDSLFALTTSGDLVTDLIRRIGAEGDGRPVEDSYGIWPDRTNLHTNSVYASSIGGVTSENGITVVHGRLSPTPTPPVGTFGAVLRASGAGQLTAGLYQKDGSFCTVTAGTIYTVSALSAMDAPYGARTARLRIQWRDATTVLSDVTGPSFTLTDYNTRPWTRLRFTATAPAGATRLRLLVEFPGVSSGEFYWISGPQIETGRLATPIIPTNGASASRIAGRVETTRHPLTGSRGSIAALLRLGVATDELGLATDNPRIAELHYGPAGVTNLIHCTLLMGGAPQFRIFRGNGTTGETLDVVIPALPVGSIVLAVARWNATTISVSFNNAAFTDLASASVPAGATAALGIGCRPAVSGAANQQVCSDVLWFAAGGGYVTDADRALLAARLAGRPEPLNYADLPASFRV